MLLSLTLLPVAVAQDEVAFDLDAMTAPELREFALIVQEVLTDELLTTDPRHAEEQAELLELPHTGIVRLLDRYSWLTREIQIPGSGSYVSFDLRAHAYSNGPDLVYETGGVRPGGFARDVGWLLDLGDVPLADLPDEPGPPPEYLESDAHPVWEACWSPIQEVLEGDSMEDFRRYVPAEPGRTAIVRVHLRRRHDVLVGVRFLERDEVTATIAFRVLHHWPVPDVGPLHDPQPPRPRRDPEVVAWLEGLGVDGNVALLAEARRIGMERLLAVPDDLRAKYREVLEGRNSFAQRAGLGRVTYRGDWDSLDVEMGGASYYSFLHERNGWRHDVDLDLQRSGFLSTSDVGLFLELGSLELDELRLVADGVPPRRLRGVGLEGWELLHDLRVERDEHGRAGLIPDDAQAAGRIGLARSVHPFSGHAYLVRSADSGHDHLVLLAVIESDEVGVTFAWKVLESYATR